MKKVLIAALAAAASLSATVAQAQDAFTIQLKWVTQSQFAGYYVAKDKGFYDAVGLDVTIKPGGPDIAPPQILAGGGADILVEWMPAALSAREKGLPLVNVAQPFKSSGMMLTCRRDSGIASTDDLAGKTLGVWFFGNEFPFLSWMQQLGLGTDGGDNGVTVLQQGFNVDPIFNGQADCVSTMTYNEYWQVIDGGLSADELIVFKYEDQGVATLEDGLYVHEDNLSDPAFVDRLTRFIAASMEGWKYAEANVAEAAEIVLDNDDSGTATFEDQSRMMGEIAKLTAGSNGALDPADYERTVATLLAGGDAVISAAPEGAWTHAITDAALKSAVFGHKKRGGDATGWCRPLFLWGWSELAGGEAFVFHHKNILEAVLGLRRTVDVFHEPLVRREVAGIAQQYHQLIHGIDEPEPPARGREVAIDAFFAVADQVVAARQFKVRVRLGGVEGTVGVVAGDQLPAVRYDRRLATLDVTADGCGVLQFVVGVEGDVAAVLAIVGQRQRLRLCQHGFCHSVDLLEGQLLPMVVVGLRCAGHYQRHADEGSGNGEVKLTTEPEQGRGREHGDLDGID